MDYVNVVRSSLGMYKAKHNIVIAGYKSLDVVTAINLWSSNTFSPRE